jgi:hypothetical protein
MQAPTRAATTERGIGHRRRRRALVTTGLGIRQHGRGGGGPLCRPTTTARTPSIPELHASPSCPKPRPALLPCMTMAHEVATCRSLHRVPFAPSPCALPALRHAAAGEGPRLRPPTEAGKRGGGAGPGDARVIPPVPPERV